jgi:hypothetical protein
LDYQINVIVQDDDDNDDGDDVDENQIVMPSSGTEFCVKRRGCNNRK